MKIKSIKILFSVIFLVSLFSCRKELDIDIPNRERSIVVNSVLTSDSQINVNITRSTHILDDVVYDTIEGVKVTITENNLLVHKLKNNGNGMYSSSLVPIAGKKYSIEVAAPDFKTVNSEFIMPQPVEMTSFSYTLSVENKDEYLSNDYYKVEFQDPQGQKNYYAIDVFLRTPYIENYVDTLTNEIVFDPYIYNPVDYTSKLRENLIPVVVYNDNPVTFNTDEIIIDEFGRGIENSGVLFTDELFDGKKYSFKFYLNHYSYSYEDPYYYSPYDSLIGTIGNKLIVKFSTISEEFFLYLKSYYHQNSIKNEFGDFWLENLLERREAVPVFTNIENGFGIFGGYSTFIDSIETKKSYY